MRILITAGGTAEKIDEVRCITNHSSGAMGSAVAEAFLHFEQTEEIIYVCGESAITPQNTGKFRIIRVTDVSDLQKTLQRVLIGEKVDGIIHCMAVSDYTVDTITSTELLESRISDELSYVDPAEITARLPVILNQCLHTESEITASGKINSDMDDLILVLKKTPKIISIFKTLQPQVVLVGFKLLNRVTVDTLIKAGVQLMQSNGCDFVFANDKSEVTPEQHCGYLLQPDGSFEKIVGRAQIAKKIASAVMDQIIQKDTK